MLDVSNRLKTSDPEYFYALCVSALFLSASLVIVSFSPESRIGSADVAISYAVLITWVSCRMMNRPGGTSALPFFLLGTAIFFGMGTYIAVHEPQAHNFFTIDEQEHLLSKVNLVNALSVFVIVLFAGIQGRRPAGGVPAHTAAKTLELFLPWLPGLLLLALPSHALAWITFPHVESNLLHSILRLIDFFTLFAVFIGAALFHRVRPVLRAIILMLVVLYFLEGMLSLSKRTMLSPILVLGSGFWIGGYYRRAAGLMFVTGVAAYFLLLTAIVPLGRGHALYHPFKNTVSERTQIVSEVLADLPNIDHSHRRDKAFSRLSPTQFSASFILSYDLGARGESLSQASYVLIPRIFWSDKPPITPGKHFDSIWRGAESTSGLGITYSAEAYWNYGWAGVVVVSIYMGLMIGWFSGRWYKYQRYGVAYIGVFIFHPWASRNLLLVESSVVGTFFGGMIKLAVLILLLDVTIRVLRALPLFADRLDAMVHPALVSPGPAPGMLAWVHRRIDLMRFYAEARRITFRFQSRKAVPAG